MKYIPWIVSHTPSHPTFPTFSSLFLRLLTTCSCRSLTVFRPSLYTYIYIYIFFFFRMSNSFCMTLAGSPIVSLSLFVYLTFQHRLDLLSDSKPLDSASLSHLLHRSGLAYCIRLPVIFYTQFSLSFYIYTIHVYVYYMYGHMVYVRT